MVRTRMRSGLSTGAGVEGFIAESQLRDASMQGGKATRALCIRERRSSLEKDYQQSLGIFICRYCILGSL